MLFGKTVLSAQNQLGGNEDIPALFTSDSALAGATLTLDVTRPSFPNAIVSLDWIWHGGWECCVIGVDDAVVGRLEGSKAGLELGLIEQGAGVSRLVVEHSAAS